MALALRDYILCDGCESKLIYDGYDNARDTFDDAKPPLLLCGDCAQRRGTAIERVKAAADDLLGVVPSGCERERAELRMALAALP